MSEGPDPRPAGSTGSTGRTDSTATRRRGGAVVGAVVLLGAAFATLAIVGWAGDTASAPFEPGSVADVIGAAGRAGLDVCSVREEPDPLARQAVSSATLRLATDCADPHDDATVVVDRYTSAADRDAVARELTARNRPRGSGVVYTWRDMTILTRGDGDDAVRERLETVLRGSGAR